MKGYAEKRRLLRFEKGNVQATDRKRKRQKIFKLVILSIPLTIILITIINIMSNRNNTVATFNLAIPKTEEKKLYTVCIDPGHGDWDYGAISPNGTAEKDITLAVSLKLGLSLIHI